MLPNCVLKRGDIHTHIVLCKCSKKISEKLMTSVLSAYRK